ncbi:MAG TPA: hypothetical protein VHT51_02220, partial [Micropepsaceae bacterium]|nr:hypothetical protein [Micropepsaceae bacterium]
MATNELDGLFESLLEETDGVENLELTMTRVALTAALTRVHPAMSAKPNGTEAVTPDTYLDDIYEQDAAQHFLERLSSHAMPVPADLIVAVIADGVREPKPVSARRGWKILPLTNRWGWAAGAMGVLVLALLGFRISEQVVAPGVIAPPADAVANLQAPYRANMDVTSPPPPRPRPEKSDARIDGRNF